MLSGSLSEFGQLSLIQVLVPSVHITSARHTEHKNRLNLVPICVTECDFHGGELVGQSRRAAVAAELAASQVQSIREKIGPSRFRRS